MTTTASRTLKKVLWEKQLLCMCITLFGTFLCRKCTTTSDTHADVTYSYLCGKNKRIGSWKKKNSFVTITKTMFVNSGILNCQLQATLDCNRTICLIATGVNNVCYVVFEIFLQKLRRKKLNWRYLLIRIIYFIDCSQFPCSRCAGNCQCDAGLPHFLAYLQHRWLSVVRW